jgi:hypothetical protein
MAVMVAELYEALRKAGVDEEMARAASRAVLAAEARTDLATKADLADAKAEIIKWMFGMLGAQTALLAALKLLA